MGEDLDPRGQVGMSHPQLPATQQSPVKVTRRQFDVVWAGRGWTLAGGEQTPAASQPAGRPVTVKTTGKE